MFPHGRFCSHELWVIDTVIHESMVWPAMKVACIFHNGYVCLDGFVGGIFYPGQTRLLNGSPCWVFSFNVWYSLCTIITSVCCGWGSISMNSRFPWMFFDLHNFPLCFLINVNLLSSVMKYEDGDEPSPKLYSRPRTLIVFHSRAFQRSSRFE